MALREIPKSSTQLPENENLQTGKQTASYRYVPNTPNKDLNDFIEISRLLHEIFAENDSSYEPGNWSDDKVKNVIESCCAMFQTCKSKAETTSHAEGFSSDELHKIMQTIQDKIAEKNPEMGQFDKNCNMSIILIACYSFSSKKPLFLPLFKVYNHNGRRSEKHSVQYISLSGFHCSSITEFIDHDLTGKGHCLVCIPKDGEYIKPDGSTSVPLNFFHINAEQSQTCMKEIKPSMTSYKMTTKNILHILSLCAALIDILPRYPVVKIISHILKYVNILLTFQLDSTRKCKLKSGNYKVPSSAMALDNCVRYKDFQNYYVKEFIS